MAWYEVEQHRTSSYVIEQYSTAQYTQNSVALSVSIKTIVSISVQYSVTRTGASSSSCRHKHRHHLVSSVNGFSIASYIDVGPLSQIVTKSADAVAIFTSACLTPSSKGL